MTILSKQKFQNRADGENTTIGGNASIVSKDSQLNFYVNKVAEFLVILKNVTPAFVYVFFGIISSTLIKDAKPNKVCDTHIQ